MRRKLQSFDPRQEMLHPDFEIAHKIDTNLTNVGLHHHAFYEIDLLLSGDVTYVIEDKIYKLRTGDVLIINPYESHQVFIQTGTVSYERYMLWVSEELVCRLSSQRTDLTRCFVDIRGRKTRNLVRLQDVYKNYVTDLMEMLYNNCTESAYGADIFPASVICCILVLLNMSLSENNTQEETAYNNELVSQVISYIAQHYDEVLSLSRLSEQFYVSKYHLSRVFSRETGISLCRYVRKKRLSVACQMLMEGITPQKAAAACGFNDYTSFYRAFRTEYDMSPKEYAQRWKERQIR